MRNGALEHAERSEGVDIGLRVFIGQRSAIVSGSDVRPDTIATMAERAVAMAKEAPEDPYTGLADASELSQAHDTLNLEMADDTPEPTAAELEEDARRAEAPRWPFRRHANGCCRRGIFRIGCFHGDK